MKRTFKVTLGIEATLVLDEDVINHVDDDFRKHLYPLNTPEEIAEHIARNMVLNGCELIQLDGWADLSNDLAKCKVIGEEISAVEVTP